MCLKKFELGEASWLDGDGRGGAVKWEREWPSERIAPHTSKRAIVDGERECSPFLLHLLDLCQAREGDVCSSIRCDPSAEADSGAEPTTECSPESWRTKQPACLARRSAELTCRGVGQN